MHNGAYVHMQQIFKEFSQHVSLIRTGLGFLRQNFFLRPKGSELWLATVLLFYISLQLGAQPLPLQNGSFESPVTAFVDLRVDAWQKTPKPDWYDESGGFFWDQLIGTFRNTDPGKPDHIDNIDGDQAVYIFAVPQVGLSQDLPNATFEAGHSYRAAFGVAGGGGGMQEGVILLLTMYYRDGSGNPVTVAATTITNTKAAFPAPTHLVDFSVDTPPVKPSDPWAGKPIGLRVYSVVSTTNPALAGGYWDLDNVGLTVAAGLQFQLKISKSAAGATISWPSVIGFNYQMKTTQDFKTWSNEGGSIGGTGSDLATTVQPADHGHAFYAVVATPVP
jgi:hypothetical protein